MGISTIRREIPAGWLGMPKATRKNAYRDERRRDESQILNDAKLDCGNGPDDGPRERNDKERSRYGTSRQKKDAERKDRGWTR